MCTEISSALDETGAPVAVASQDFSFPVVEQEVCDQFIVQSLFPTHTLKTSRKPMSMQKLLFLSAHIYVLYHSRRVKQRLSVICVSINTVV